MRLELAPRRLDAAVGGPAVLTVALTNTDDVIAGYSLRFLGADASWVQMDHPEPTLFPGESMVVTITLALPPGLPAGERRMAVQVRELTGERRTLVEEVVVDVAGAPALAVRLDPPIVTGGRRAVFGLVVTNTGNTTMDSALVGTDPERRITFTFVPPRFALSPGEQAVAELRTSARRRLAGSPEPRPFQLRVEGGPPDAPPDALGAFVQRPVLSRGLLTMLGLLAAVTLFAIVVTSVLSSVVQRSASDRDLALQVAQARDEAPRTGTSSLAGRVLQLSTGDGLTDVSVEVFDEADTAAPLRTSATADSGTFDLGGLPAGSYKLRFRAAGFDEVWYPSAATDADAEVVEVAAGQDRTDLTVLLGGVPATISGTVTGSDVAGAVVRLELPLDTGVLAGVVPPEPGEAPATATSGAVVRSVPVGGDGTFSLEQVPSPAVYDLVTSKPGFSTQVQRIDVAAGENRAGLEVQLLDGDGAITGVVSGTGGPIPGASVVATFGELSVRTVTLTQDEVGGFALRGLPTPGSFTVVVSAPGFAPATLNLTLGPGQQLTGVAVTLGAAAGTLGGTVSVPAGVGGPGGVAITVSDGADTRQTISQSQDPAGSWAISGLRIPSTYTVTFTRADLESQVLSVSIDGFGTVTTGAASATAVDVQMRAATARLVGTVTQTGAGGGAPTRAGNVVVAASSGVAQLQVTTASTPAGAVGDFVLDGLPPGTYTVTFSRKGTRPTSTIVTLVAGQERRLDPVLVAPAAISGSVTQDGTGVVGAVVDLYLASQYGTAALPVVSVRTDANGRYAIADVDAPSFYVLEVRLSANSAPMATSAPLTLQASQQLSYDIAVNP